MNFVMYLDLDDTFHWTPNLGMCLISFRYEEHYNTCHSRFEIMKNPDWFWVLESACKTAWKCMSFLVLPWLCNMAAFIYIDLWVIYNLSTNQCRWKFVNWKIPGRPPPASSRMILGGVWGANSPTTVCPLFFKLNRR